MVARIAQTIIGVCFMVSVFGSYWLVNAQQRKQEPQPESYALKPTKPPSYTPPHKPHTRLADVKAKHKGKKEWSEWVVQDAHLWSQYVQSAPGSRVSPRFHPDTRIWWVIIEGQIRFNIEGQESFVARRRSMVQVPPQTIYSMETLGDQPAIRFETQPQGSLTLFVEPPSNTPGFEPVPVRLGGGRVPFPYGDGNKPHINLDDLAAADPEYRGGRFVDDARGVSNIIYVRDPRKLAPLDENNRGHFHPGASEFWLIMAGQVRYPLSGHGVVIASEGDLVYAPRFTWHAPRPWGDEPSCRLAMDGSTRLATGRD